MARIARWFIDITLDSETLRWWSGDGPISLGGQTYTGLGTRWVTPESLKRKASLKSEKIELEFDSSRQSDNSDPIGHLLDQKWRNRAVRLRRLAWTAGQAADAGDVLADERGRIRDLSDSLQMEKPARVSMEIESGALAYLERRRETRSPAGQKAVYPDDKGFDLIAVLEGKTLAWRTKHKKAGTVQYELNEEYEPHPREWVLGRFAKTGSFVAAFTGQQQNKNLMRVYALADHRINKLDRVWINGDLMVSSPLVHGVRTEIPALRSGGPRAWITFYEGRPDQTADGFLQSVEPTWTSAHRLRGVAYVIIDHLWDSDLSNAYDYRFGGEGARLYDRRQDSTAGGIGSQRWDDPATWTYSTNAMVAIDHYRSGVRVDAGSQALWFGVGESLDAVPYAEFAALANHCDENVNLKAGGTQKRYEVNGTISAEQSHDKNLQALADQMAARAIDQGGRIAVRPPIIRTPVITLTDADLIRGSASEIRPGGKIDDMVNTLSGRFINPANDYKRDDYPEVQIADYVEDDNGEISDTLNLDLENSAERAQRIAKLRIEDSRRILEITETYGTKAKAIEPGEWFVRESTIRGFPSGKTFVADEVTRYIDGSMEVVATEVDPDQLVWDEETAVDLSVPPSYPQLELDDLEVPGGSATPRQITRNDVNLPGVDIVITYGEDPLPYSTDVEVTEDDGTGGPLAGAEVIRRHIPAGGNLLSLAGELTPNTDYVYRARANFDGRIGAWSDWMPFTTGGYAVPASIADPLGPLQQALDSADEAVSTALDRGTEALNRGQAALDRLQPIDGSGGRLDLLETTTDTLSQQYSQVAVNLDDIDTSIETLTQADDEAALQITRLKAARGGNSIIPDWNYTDPDFWDSSGFAFVEGSPLGTGVRGIRVASGTHARQTPEFEAKAGEYYRARLIAETSSDFSGFARPFLHVLGERFAALNAGGASMPDPNSPTANQPGDITGANQSINVTYDFVSNAVRDALQLIFRATINAGSITYRVELKQLPQGSEISQLFQTTGDQAQLITSLDSRADDLEGNVTQLFEATEDNATAILQVEQTADDAETLAQSVQTAAQNNATIIDRVRLSRGGSDSIVPDPNFRDPVFWGFHGNHTFAEGGPYATGVRSIMLSDGYHDLYSEWFRVEPGNVIEVDMPWWNGFASFSGWVRPILHVPNERWAALNGNHASIDPNSMTNDQPGDIATPATSGVANYRFTVPNNVYRLQFLIRASFSGGNVYLAPRLRRLSQAAEISTIQQVIIDPNTGQPKAIWGVRQDVNGKVSGVQSVNDGTVRNFDILTDVFRISDGSTNVQPFVYSGGNLYLQNLILGGNLIAAGTVGRAVFSNGEKNALVAEGLAANYYEQTGTPSGALNGALWFNPTTKELKIRRSNAWGLIAVIASADTVFRAVGGVGNYIGSATGDVLNNAVPITLLNGTAPYFFGTWQIINAPPGASIVSGGSSPNMRAGNLTAGQTLSAVIGTTVYDSAGGAAPVSTAFRWTNTA